MLGVEWCLMLSALSVGLQAERKSQHTHIRTYIHVYNTLGECVRMYIRITRRHYLQII